MYVIHMVRRGALISTSKIYPTEAEALACVRRLRDAALENDYDVQFEISALG